MPQLTIYLSDEVSELVTRHRSALRVSQVCAEALRWEAIRLELSERGKQDLQAVVERLRAEKAQADLRVEELKKQGAAAAAAWIAQARYTEIVEMASRLREVNNAPDGQALIPEEACLAFLRIGNRDCGCEAPDSVPLRHPEVVHFIAGWWVCFDKLWAVLKDYL